MKTELLKQGRCQARPEMGLGSTFNRHKWSADGVCLRCEREINPAALDSKMFRSRETLHVN